MKHLLKQVEYLKSSLKLSFRFIVVLGIRSLCIETNEWYQNCWEEKKSLNTISTKVEIVFIAAYWLSGLPGTVMSTPPLCVCWPYFPREFVVIECQLQPCSNENITQRQTFCYITLYGTKSMFSSVFLSYQREEFSQETVQVETYLVW